MRISDWSSDVCSSDLYGRYRRWACKHSAGSDFRRGQAGYHPLPPCLSRRADPKRLYLDAVRQAFAADGHDPQWFSDTKSPHPDREWHPGLRNDRREHLPHSQAVIDLVRSSSEEHTSELQSLMLHWYSVFCFTIQKKNKS